MRKSLLLVFLMALCVSAFTQKSPIQLKPGNYSTAKLLIKDYDDNHQLTTTPSVVNFIRPNVKGTSDISVINLGNAANGFGLYNGGRTAIWADPNINSVAFFHRMIANPGSGYVAYDISKDGGDTWTLNNQIFNPTVTGTANARYPQGVLYNPTGNTVADNAYAAGFFPTLDGTNTGGESWGGYGAATVKLDGTGLSQVGWPSDPPIRHNVPDAMAINPVTGDIFIVEPSFIDGLATGYTDTLIIARGVFNATTGAYEYEETPFYAPMIHLDGESAIADCRVAFAPDGLIGYIAMLADNGEDEFATETGFYPVFYKTTDGGLNWDGPITVPLGGPEGLEGVVNDLISDSLLAEIFAEPLPARDELPYTTAFTSDFAVDMNGNPVLTVVIGLSGMLSDPPQPYSILTEEGWIGSYNIWSHDQGTTWLAAKLGPNLKRFRGTWTGADPVEEDNRSQVSCTMDGKVMFFSWLDTHLAETEDNSTPDIFCVGWNVETNMYTEVFNVTYLSDAWLQANMGTASYYVFTPAEGTYEIPFVYQTFTDNNPDLQVQYKYIKDFVLTDADFTIVKTQDNDVSENVVSQNFPNPFSSFTNVTVNLTKKSTVGLEVYNLVGQKVYEIPSATLASGSHQLTIPAKGMKKGIYAYSVMINGERYSNKMIVE